MAASVKQQLVALSGGAGAPKERTEKYVTHIQQEYFNCKICSSISINCGSHKTKYRMLLQFCKKSQHGSLATLLCFFSFLLFSNPWLVELLAS